MTLMLLTVSTAILGAIADTTSNEDEDAKKKTKIRSPDIVVIGWIDPENVPLSRDDVSDGVLSYYPFSGKIEYSYQKALTAIHIGWLATLGNTHPILPRSLTPRERTYILHWLFKFAANDPPPESFATAATLEAFASQATGYKLYNRLCIEYYVDQSGSRTDDTVITVESDVRIGVTTDPIFNGLKPGESGPKNGEIEHDDSFVAQINDGSPDKIAVRAFNTLVGNGLKWSNIGSRIEIGFNDSYSVTTQVYPTYFIYESRDSGSFEIVEKRLQAPDPSMNFYANPYPPGPAPFVP